MTQIGQPSRQKRTKPSFIDANIRVPQHLTSLLIEAVNGLSSETEANRYLKEVFLSKFVSKDTDPADLRRERAIDKWLAQEVTNRETNERLWSLDEGFNILPRVSWTRFVRVVQGYVLRVLGEVPPDAALIGGFSGGASTSRKRTEGHPALKFTGQAHSTRHAWEVFEGVTLRELPSLSRSITYCGEPLGFELVPPTLANGQRTLEELCTSLHKWATTDGVDPDDHESLSWAERLAFYDIALVLVKDGYKDFYVVGHDCPQDPNLWRGGVKVVRPFPCRTALELIGSFLVVPEKDVKRLPDWDNGPGSKAICSIKYVEGNEMFTVPKDATIDRVACKEPDVNMYLQKGVGNYIRRQLRKFGINLNDQSRNQRLAREGSITGQLATVDLSSASDSVTTSLVEILLPPLWYSLLDTLRSPITRVRGEDHANEMFSSMGNGFTFELESLIFWAIARAVAYFENSPGVVSVYGDDIILPADCYPSLEYAMKVLGFKVNPKKSFSTGPFRESCGGHYYNGLDITPFYLRKPIDRLTDLIQACNQIRLWSERTAHGWVDGLLSPTLEDLWKALADHVPPQFWGGHDYNSIYSLVSPGRPNKRLVEIRGDRLTTGVGGLVQWFHSTDGTSELSEGVETSFRSNVVKRCRVKPQKHYGDWRSVGIFPMELSSQ